MKVYRICKRTHASRAFRGEGARRYAGRWHHAGIPLVYTARSLALAAFEQLVHFDLDIAPAGFVSIEVDIPRGVKIRRPAKTLPANWDAIPAVDETRDFGSRWFESMSSVAMVVPSAVIVGEMNVLLNPLHADFAKLVRGKPRPFVFDPRLR
ncbi:MAG: RES family NAD+ phosphorylase [Myxococcota bacterium]|jgi:RES domain-containing protein|nr:RES family NAD+ phosphorylase [Myxococcota bacterium]